MGTASQIITDALKLLRVYQSGENLGASEGQDGLRSLNLMLDGWANERLMLFQLVERTHALTATTESYTIGSGGDIDTTRPVKIENAFTRDADDHDLQIAIISNDEYSQIHDKTLDGTYPLYLYYRPNYPLGTINLYPAPGSGLTLHLQVWDQLTQFTNLTTSASFPPGYERCLIYNLAIELAPMFGTTVTQEIAKIANESKAWIKTVNFTVQRLEYDLPALSMSGRCISKAEFFSGDF
jgi:hypothetical protein